MNKILTHYHYENAPACGAEPIPNSIPAYSPNKCSCTPCSLHMIAESDTVKEMEQWTVRYQQLRKETAYEENKQKEADLLEQMRTAPLSIPAQHSKGMFRPDTDNVLPVVPFAKPLAGMFRRHQHRYEYPFDLTESALNWRLYLDEQTHRMADLIHFLRSKPIPVDLWLEAPEGTTCGHIRSCREFALQISIDQHGFPITRCYIPEEEPEYSDQDFRDWIAEYARST